MTQPDTAAAAAPAAALARSSFAVQQDVMDGLPKLVEAMQLRSVAQLLTLLVRERDAVVPALAPVVAAFKAKLPDASGGKASARALKKRLEGADPETLAKIEQLLSGGGGE